MTAGATEDTTSYVIRVPAVKESVSALRARHIHPFFPAYLHIRQQAGRASQSSEIPPDWTALGTLLEVPGGPFGRPYFRPFWTGSANQGQEWLNPNLAGSYAPSSIRELPRRVIEIRPTGKFSLREKHWELARQHFTDDKPVPVLALASFFFRDFPFLCERVPERADLVHVFLTEFGYRDAEDDMEVNHLFDQTWTGEEDPWFEPAVEAAAE